MHLAFFVGEGLDPPLTYRYLSIGIVQEFSMHVILSEHSESKDLRTNLTRNFLIVRRSLDSTLFRSG